MVEEISDSVRKYRVIFSGKLADGASEPSVKRAVAVKFKLEGERFDRFFGGEPLVVKVCEERDVAEKYKAVLTEIGLVCLVTEAGEPESHAIRPPGPRTKPAVSEEKPTRAPATPVVGPAVFGERSPLLETKDSEGSSSGPKKRCPYCGEDMLAVAKKCEHCGSAVKSKQGTDKKDGSTTSSKGTTKCKSCGKEVATTAKTCLHCGQKDPSVNALPGIAVSVGFVAFAWVFYSIFGSGPGIDTPTTALPSHLVADVTSLAPRDGRRINVEVTDSDLSRSACKTLIREYKIMAGPEGQVAVHKPTTKLADSMNPWCVDNMDGEGVFFDDQLF